jgi:hypothetical protein
MTRKEVESAIESGVPFTLRIADGRKYSACAMTHATKEFWIDTARRSSF